jgi:hypothetical protein
MISAPVAIQFWNSVASNFYIARQSVGGEDLAHVAGFVADDLKNLDFVASGCRQRHDIYNPQIVERQPKDARSYRRLAPCTLEPAFAPWFTLAAGQYNRRHSWRGIARSLKRVRDRDQNVRARFASVQSELFAVIGRPWKLREVALPLSGADRQQHLQEQAQTGSV